jgi:hypothetical protein
MTIETKYGIGQTVRLISNIGERKWSVSEEVRIDRIEVTPNKNIVYFGTLRGGECVRRRSFPEPDAFPTEAAAQDECNRRNGALKT